MVLHRMPSFKSSLSTMDNILNSRFPFISLNCQPNSRFLAHQFNTQTPSPPLNSLDPAHFLIPKETQQLSSPLSRWTEAYQISNDSSTKSCFNETVWQAGDYMLGPIHPPPRFVITGGALGIPGPNTLKNWFKIEKYEMRRPHSYKLRYCPSKYICPTCNFDCADVGLTYNSGYYRLALNNKPYPFGITKVNKNDA
ncbi:hypothetical protein H5410_017618 [Solanum commersonii]|uniref:Stigma expressed protein n=1 Tax=Solanum commersonii TaxID=4109 RepID=A0A9J6A0I6_SOLCO|nr:hypothetical protein H5410_017618 [Solanum commersonii]